MPPALTSIISKTRLRIRLQRALEAATTCGIICAVYAMVVVFLFKLGKIPLEDMWLYMIAGAAGVLAGAVAGAVRPVPARHAAKRIDNSHDLHDRIGTAVEFSSEAERSPFMDAQIRDALAHAPRVEPRRAAPFLVPRDLRAVAVLAVCLLFVAAVRFPSEASTAKTAAAAPRATLEVDPEALEPYRALAKELKREAEEEQDKDLAALADELNKLFEKINKQELTRKELFAKLAELEKKYFDGVKGNFDELLKQLKKMGTELQKDKLTLDAAKALKEGKLKKAQQELAKLAEKLDKLKKNDQRRLADRLKKASQQPKMDKKDRALKKEQQRLKEQIRRLKKKLAKRPKDQQMKRRLRRKKRQLQRLNRQRQQLANQRRQLQRLNKNMNKAAAGLRQKLSPEARKALQKAAQQMGRFANQVNKLRLRNKAQGQMADLKEMLRRLGKGNKGRQGKMRVFHARAKKGLGKGKGKGKGKGQKGFMIDPNGKGGTLIMPVPGQGQGQGQGQDSPNGQPGDGVGSGSNHAMGDPTKMKVKKDRLKVQGKHGRGPNRSEVILGASEKGFSSKNYRRVFSAYSPVIEDVLKREDVPLGYKYYVKLYFQLIRPR